MIKVRSKHQVASFRGTKYQFQPDPREGADEMPYIGVLPDDIGKLLKENAAAFPDYEVLGEADAGAKGSAVPAPAAAVKPAKAGRSGSPRPGEKPAPRPAAPVAPVVAVGADALAAPRSLDPSARQDSESPAHVVSVGDEVHSDGKVFRVARIEGGEVFVEPVGA